VIPSPASASLARGVVRVTDILRGGRRRPVRSGVERYCVERAVRFESPTATFTHLNGVSCAAAASCKAVGYFEVAATANNPKALAEAWNGHSWELQHAVAPSGATYNTLASVSCVSTTFCEAVGAHFAVHSQPFLRRAEHSQRRVLRRK
jgi:hypothetical protein